MKTFNKINGFTLVEMIVIIGLIGVIVSGMIILIDPAAQLAKGRDSQRKSDMKTMQTALELYRADNSVYPPFGTGYGHWYARGLQINEINNITYLRSFPEDPNDKRDECDGYLVFNDPSGYTIYTNLENLEDDDADEAKPEPAICPTNSCSSNNISTNVTSGTCIGSTYNYWVNSP